jgi:uncharacterized protein|tara:strand:- start:857 stop:1402 length:546 start_codon:yes stop_codon:yes gene_type:complete
MQIIENDTYLPQYVDPRRLSAQGKTLTGSVDSKLLSRVRGAVTEISSAINVNMSFYLEDQGRRVVNIRASVPVKVICQRCLSKMSLKLECDTILCIVWNDDEAIALPKNLEAWIVSENKANLIDLIEEELLLALPFVSYHNEKECSNISFKNWSSESKEKINEVEIKHNPFQALKSMKEKI